MPAALSRARERLLRRISTRKGREAERVVPVEGPRAIGTALDHGAKFSFALVEEGAGGVHARIAARLADSGAEVIALPRETVRAFSDTDAPQGIVAVASEPESSLPAVPRPSAAKRAPGGPSGASRGLLLLDAVQEPGNVGALVRVAAALGLDRVIALDGSADPWSGKAVRASAGLVFALPIHPVPWEEAHAWIDRTGLPLLVADGGGEDVRRWLSRVPALAGGWALALGNEGSGPRPAVVAAASARLAIPLAPGVESLNVATAGAVLAWALGPGRS